MQKEKDKSNSDFIGHAFVKFVFDFVPPNVNAKYRVVPGPLWVKSLEWIEWDGALVRKGARSGLPNYFKTKDIIALFEMKVGGIVGGRENKKKEEKQGMKKKQAKTVTQAIASIRSNFIAAEEKCPNLKKCFYIALRESRPQHMWQLKKERLQFTINYYEYTKRMLNQKEIVTCLMFDSSSIDRKKNSDIEFPREWENLMIELNRI
ncbi:MAG: hypothetical protein ABSC20_07130 [Candidatus Bathyarchaeia archaeon]